MRAGKSGRRARAESAQRKHQTDNHAADLVDQLRAFEEFRTELLPAIKRDLKSGLSADQLRKKYQAWVQARLIMNALTDPDAGKSTTAAKDLLDRVEGKAKETVDHNHRLQDVPEEELDAIVMSELKSVGLSDDQDPTLQ
jgi:hypothetical protein